MRKLFNYTIFFLLTTLTHTSCSNKEEVTSLNEGKENLVLTIKNTENIDFANISQSLSITSSDGIIGVHRYENGDYSSGLKYIITKNQEPLYIVNSIFNELIVRNIQNNSVEKIKTNNAKIELISLAKENRENTNRKFWGWACSTWNDPNGNCVGSCCYYVLWGVVTCGTYSCDDLPGNQQQTP